MAFSYLVGFAVVVLVLAQSCQGENYVAEGYFVVDNEAVELYIREMPGTETYATKRAVALQKMNQDIGYMVTEINELFKSLSSSGLNLDIRVRRVDILNSNFFAKSQIVNGNLLSTDLGLRTFRNWLAVRYAFQNVKFDFAIYWTGFGLYQGETSQRKLGISYIGKACDQYKAIGVVQYNATYQTVTVTAMQIAHILGASNEGVASRYLLTSQADPRFENRWTFSDCTATSIKDFIKSQSASCLIQTSADSVVPNQSWTTYTGEMFDPDTICRRRLNDTRSYLCQAPSLYNQSCPGGNAICQAMYCRIPGTNLCVATYPSEGMICDTNSRCDDGACKRDQTPDFLTADPNCLYGDQGLIEFQDINFSGTCSQLIQQEGLQACYNIVVQRFCCATCKKTGPAGCEFGDRSSMCVQNPQSAVCPQYKDDLCCDYCKYFRRKRSNRVNATETVFVYQDVIDVGKGEQDRVVLEVEDVVVST